MVLSWFGSFRCRFGLLRWVGETVFRWMVLSFPGYVCLVGNVGVVGFFCCWESEVFVCECTFS
jgi:hypothetical protein